MRFHDFVIDAASATIKFLVLPILSGITVFIGKDDSVNIKKPVWSTAVAACINSFVQLLKTSYTLDSKRTAADTEPLHQSKDVTDAVTKAYEFACCQLTHKQFVGCANLCYDAVTNQCLQLMNLVFCHRLLWNHIVDWYDKFTGIWTILVNFHLQLCANITEKTCNARLLLQQTCQQDGLLAATETCIRSYLGVTVVEEMERAVDHLHTLTVSLHCSVISHLCAELCMLGAVSEW